MLYRPALIAGMLIPLAASFAAIANAQPLGSFSWQLQPFCNVLTISVTQQGNIYTLDGYDDQCGAPQRAPLVGTAGLNPDGTIGFGLHIITVPGGRGLSLEARITLPSLNGSWSDSTGYSGTFAFNVRLGGQPRPAPTIPGTALAAGSITTAQLATAAVTTANVAGGSITPEKLSVSPPRLISSGLTTGVVGLDRDQTATVRSATIPVPGVGQVMINASGVFGFPTGSGFEIIGRCSITTGAAVEATNYLYAQVRSPNSLANVPFAGTRVFNVAPGSFTVNLVCSALSDSPWPPGFFPVTIQAAQLTALFVANF